MTIRPEQVLQQMNRPAHWTGWVPTLSRRGFRPWDPECTYLSLYDLAYGVAHTYRYGGNSKPAVTVAEHCVLVSTIINILWPGNPRLERAGLLHDAAEGPLHDMQAPIRGMVFVKLPSGELISWSESDKLVTKKIAAEYGVTAEDLEAPEVRAADVLAACFERRACSNLNTEDDWGLPPIPPEIDHLWIRCMPPMEAMGLFLKEALRLGIHDVRGG